MQKFARYLANFLSSQSRSPWTMASLTCEKGSKTRSGSSLCTGRVICLSPGLSRRANLSAGARVCLRHWKEIDRADKVCVCPLQQHSKKLESSHFIPARLYPVFDDVGKSLADYQPGSRWCNHCHKHADSEFKHHPLYQPPTKNLKVSKFMGKKTLIQPSID